MPCHLCMKPTLIDPAQAAQVSGLHLPDQLYWVLDHPAPLAGMQWPRGVGKVFWDTLHAAGFRWIVCLSSLRPKSGYDPAPIETLLAVELTDLCDGGNPDNPEVEEKEIRAIASRVLEKLQEGEGVILHCAGGRGRTGTVLGVVLKLLGFEDEEILSFLNRVHRLRSREGWPESGWQEQVVLGTRARK